MNAQFLVAIVFGAGTSIALAQFFDKSPYRLSTRVVFSTKQKTQPFPNAKVPPIDWLKNTVRSRQKLKLERALQELPEIIELLIVCLRAGDGIYRSFSQVVPRCEGEIAKELNRVMKAVSLGASFVDEIRLVPNRLPHAQISEFVSKVALAFERGTPLAQMLSDQATSARSEIRNTLLRQAGKNETRMLIPLVFLILPITVMFAIYPSLELLNFGFI